MDYVFLGSTGLKVSTVCLGTMSFGGEASTQCSEATSNEILDAFVAAGGNFIDCADVYQKGESERILGRWLAKHKDIRHKLVIATKARGAVDPATAGPNDIGLSRAHLFKAVADSLERLQVDYIDLFQCHVWDEGTPLAETLRALDDLVKAGKVRYTGWSNCTGWQVQKIVCTCEKLGIPAPASLQEQYSLLVRQPEWEVVPVCVREGVALLPWSPLKGGWLSGKVRRDAPPPADSRVAWAEQTGAKLQSHPSYSAFKEDERVWALIDAMGEVASAHGATVPQVAIRWLLQRPGVTSVVIGAKSVPQLADNLGAARLRLSPADMARLDDLSALPAPYPYEMVNRLQAGRTRPAPVVT